MSQVPLHIVLDADVPAEARGAVERAAAVLEGFHGRIVSCRVAVRKPEHRHQQGAFFDVHLRVHVPRHPDIVVSRRAGDQHEREHLDVALHRAFDEARRQLQDAARTMRADVKSHAEPAQGRVIKLIAEQGYGFLETDDGLEVYFHQNSVADGRFAQLAVGTPVRYVLSDGEKGPQASTVVPLARPRAG